MRCKVVDASASLIAHIPPSYFIIITKPRFLIVISNPHLPAVPLQRVRLSQICKRLQQQRQQLQHYRSLCRLKKTDLSFKMKDASPTKHSMLYVHEQEGNRSVQDGKEQLEQAAAYVHAVVRCTWRSTRRSIVFIFISRSTWSNMSYSVKPLSTARTPVS
jgi:hypothetical protein